VATLLIAGLAWFSIDIFLNTRRYRVPYVSSPVSQCLPLLRTIITQYVPRPEQTAFIEPGAGLGKVVGSMARDYPWKQVIAVELTLRTYSIGKLWHWLRRSPVQFVRANALSYTYPPGAVVYCYLSTEIMARLYREKRLKGCLIISLTFPITGVKPTEEWPIPDWRKRLMVYDFRTPNLAVRKKGR
jgi:hypothetical protein